MRLELLATSEEDLGAYLNVCWAAFKDDIMFCIYPNGYTEGARNWTSRAMLEDKGKYPDRIKITKVVDHDLPNDDPNGKSVGFAYWKIYPNERTQADFDLEAKEGEEKGLPPDCNAKFLDEFHDNVKRYKKDIIGLQPFMLLNTLVVSPEYHRRGVGSMLLKEGLEQADELRLQSYLEASPMGKGLYEKMGYEVVSDFEFDARKWGLDKDLPHVCMLRPARSTNGTS